jgi:hypothetical protein
MPRLGNVCFGGTERNEEVMRICFPIKGKSCPPYVGGHPNLALGERRLPVFQIVHGTNFIVALAAVLRTSCGRSYLDERKGLRVCKDSGLK